MVCYWVCAWACCTVKEQQQELASILRTIVKSRLIPMHLGTLKDGGSRPFLLGDMSDLTYNDIHGR